MPFCGLERYNICGLSSALALLDVELHPLAFVERLITFSLDRGEVNKNIFPAFSFNKSKAFFSIEPFYCSYHFNTSNIYIYYVNIL